MLLAFIFVELRVVKHPVMPLQIFRNRNVASADAVALLVGASLFSMFFFISLYLQQVLRFSALDAGLAYLPLAFTIIISAGAASQLVTRVGPKPILVLGLVLTTIGLLLFTQISADGSFAGDVLIPSIVVAAGLGFSFVPLTITAVAGVTHNEAGLASGLINTAQQVGGALGLAILSSVANSRISDEPRLRRRPRAGAHRRLPDRLRGRRRLRPDRRRARARRRPESPQRGACRRRSPSAPEGRPRGGCAIGSAHGSAAAPSRR